MAVIVRLSPIIRGWAAYYRTVVSAEVFSALDHYVWQLTYKWPTYSHPNKPKGWIVGRYFGKFNKSRNDHWVFGHRESGGHLVKFSWTSIDRHVIVKGGASPDDPALADYWANRRRRSKPPRPAWFTPPATAGFRPASAGTQHGSPARPRGLLELPAAKVARAVLRRPRDGNAPGLSDHHDLELMDERGRVLARGRLPEGVAGVARLHELIGEQLGEDADDAEVVIGTETDRGPRTGLHPLATGHHRPWRVFSTREAGLPAGLHQRDDPEHNRHEDSCHRGHRADHTPGKRIHGRYNTHTAARAPRSAGLQSGLQFTTVRARPGQTGQARRSSLNRSGAATTQAANPAHSTARKYSNAP